VIIDRSAHGGIQDKTRASRHRLAERRYKHFIEASE
jgi:hypothetical protein